MFYMIYIEYFWVQGCFSTPWLQVNYGYLQPYTMSAQTADKKLGHDQTFLNKNTFLFIKKYSYLRAEV